MNLLPCCHWGLAPSPYKAGLILRHGPDARRSPSRSSPRTVRSEAYRSEAGTVTVHWLQSGLVKAPPVQSVASEEILVSAQAIAKQYLA